MKNTTSFGTAGLTAAGQDWLSNESNITMPSDGAFGFIGLIQDSFALSPTDAVTALASALSLLYGPSFLVKHPVGQPVPVSIQLLTGYHGQSNLDTAVEFLCQGVIDTFNTWRSSASPREQQWTKILTQMQELEPLIRHFPAAGASSLRFMPGLDPMSVITGNATNVLQDCLKDACSKPEEASVLMAILRKQMIAPVGSRLTVTTVRSLVAEKLESSFGCYDNDGTNLAYVLGLRGTQKAEILDFVNAGWTGDALTPKDGPPRFPVASCIWKHRAGLLPGRGLAEFLTRWRGFVVATAETSNASINPISEDFRERWAGFTAATIEERRIHRSLRNRSHDPVEVINLSPEAAALIIEATEFARRFHSGCEFGQEFLRHAPVHILKLAGLLHMFTNGNRDPLSEAVTRIAIEVYRTLARSTFKAASGAAAPATPTATHIEALVQRLEKKGAMTIRDLARSYNHGNYEIVSAVAEAAVLAGKVKTDGALYLAVIREPSELHAVDGVDAVDASVAGHAGGNEDSSSGGRRGHE